MIFKVLKIGQNLHVNMEGFCRVSHNYELNKCITTSNTCTDFIILSYQRLDELFMQLEDGY